LGARDECAHQIGLGLLEQWLQQGGFQGVGELELQVEIDAATALPDRRESPGPLQYFERTLHELHVHAAPGLEGVAGGEVRAQWTASHGKARDHVLAISLEDLRRRTARHELRIALDIVDDLVDDLRRTRHEGRAAHVSHHSSVANRGAALKLPRLPLPEWPRQALYNGVMPRTADAEKPIAENRRARYDYFIEERLEAGLALEGWEVKSMRAGKAQLSEAYVYIRNGEAFLIGAHLSPLRTTSTHKVADPVRTRKLLLHRNELDRLVGATERRGYTLVPLELYWKHGRAKLQLGLAKGKKQHDKRTTEKERDWQRDRARLMRRG